MVTTRAPTSPLNRANARLSQRFNVNAATEKAHGALVGKHGARFEKYLSKIVDHPALGPPFVFNVDQVFAGVSLPKGSQISLKGGMRDTLHKLSIAREDGKVALIATVPRPWPETGTREIKIPPGELSAHFPQGTVEAKALQRSLASLLDQLGKARGKLAPSPNQTEGIGL